MSAVPRLVTFVARLGTARVHPYLPFAPLTVLHAAKVTLAWTALVKGTSRTRVGFLGDLFGYLCLAWGGTTLVSLLLGTPPPWLLGATPWLVYATIYLLLVPTGLVTYINSTTPALLLGVISAIVDGLTRGSTVAALPDAVASSGLKPNAWTTALLSGIAVSGGGWIVSLLGLHEAAWRLGRPAMLDGGLWTTLDMWGGALVGLLHAALLRHHPELDSTSSLLATIISEKHLQPTHRSGPIVTPATAKAAAVLLTGMLMLLRVAALARSLRREKAKKVRARQASAVAKKEDSELARKEADFTGLEKEGWKRRRKPISKGR